MNGFLIAGTASGVGKTTATLAILAALRRRGLKVQPFKGGPDFLDTGHHSRMAGRTARNVDTWMLSHEENLNTVRNAARDAEVVVVEGMMGLFDGKSGDSEVGSSAEIAKLLKLPVVLVLDASKSARSVAAVVLGFESFDPELALAGVILNRVAGERHFTLLEDAIKGACKTPVLGWLPREPAVTIPERHLGLQTAEENVANLDAEREVFADFAEKTLDLDRLLSVTQPAEAVFRQDVPAAVEPKGKVRIGVARDAAFSFYYEDNFDLLREQGATLVFFSPLEDAELPPNLDALYLGGGYPEIYAARLSANTSLLAAVRRFAEAGGVIYAECGGMMYLGRQIIGREGVGYPMANVLPLETEMTDKLTNFGYVTVEFTRDCLLGPAGTVVRGHSFHYSRLVQSGDLETCYDVQYSLSGRRESEGFSRGNVLASYVHLHFRAKPEMARWLAEAVERHKGGSPNLR